MDFRDLSYLLAIEKYGNITKAAAALYITQPSLSKFLQGMEDGIGQPLFQRIGNRYLPTYIGERYLTHARSILSMKKELDFEIGDIIKQKVGRLRIGFPAMRGTYMLPCTLPIFRSLYPNVKIDIHEANSDALSKMLLDGEIDLAFFNYIEKIPGIDYEVISHEEVLLIVSAENELTKMAEPLEGCKHPHMELRHLRDTGIILQIPGQRTRQVVDRLFRREHFEPNIILETSNIQAEAALAARNYGVCFITETHLNHMSFGDRIRCFSVGKPACTIDFIAAFREKSYIPYHAQEYIKIVRDFT